MSESRKSGGWWRTALWIVVMAAAWLAFSHFTSRISLADPSSAPPAGSARFVGSDGDAIELASLEGRVVLVNLWASWCAPCRREIPMLQDLHEELADEGLVVLGLNSDLDLAAMRRLAGEWEISYRWVKGVGPLGAAFGSPELIPHSWLIDRRGRIRASHSGVPRLASLRAACRRLLDES